MALLDCALVILLMLILLMLCTNRVHLLLGTIHMLSGVWVPLQLLEWWYTSAEDKLAAEKKLAPPPPPPPPMPAPGGMALPSVPSLCPICRQVFSPP